MKQNTRMAKLDETKKQKERINKLEFVKDCQQDISADMEIISGFNLKTLVSIKKLFYFQYFFTLNNSFIVSKH
jgi:hypothetical protein